MRETQESVHRWIDETFPGTDPGSPRKAIRALEEMVELCLASGADGVGISQAVHRAIEGHLRARVPDYHRMSTGEKGRYWAFVDPEPDKIPSEAADVLIVLYGVAGMRGFDLHAEVDRKMQINRARLWRANGDGTGYHIKPGEADR